MNRRILNENCCHEKELILEILVTIIFLLVIWILPVFLGIRTAKRRNRSPHWMWFGIYPVVGWVVFLILRLLPARKICQSCGKKVERDARFCPHCGNEYGEQTIVPAEGSSRKSQILIRVGIIISIVIAFVAVLYLLLLLIFTNSVPYKEAFKIMDANSMVSELIGEDVRRKGFIQGSISTNGSGSGSAKISFKIQGTGGSGRLYLSSEKEFGEWEFDKLYIYDLDSTEQVINLLKGEE